MTLPALTADAEFDRLKQLCDLTTAIDSIYQWESVADDWPLFDEPRPSLDQVGTVTDHVFATQDERTQYVVDSALPHAFWDSHHSATGSTRSATGIINTTEQTVRWIAGYRDTPSSVMTTIDLTVAPADPPTRGVEIVTPPTITFESPPSTAPKPSETSIGTSSPVRILPTIRRQMADHIATMRAWGSGLAGWDRIEHETR